MAPDQLFHQRKAGKAEALRRDAEKREAYDLVLIVCEGGKTEPKYLQELRDAFRLSAANIRIAGDECGSSPRSVVDYALKTYREEKKYNRVFCVFDKDRTPPTIRHWNESRRQEWARGILLRLSHRYLVLRSGSFCISSIPLIPFCTQVDAFQM
jgi:hypothetical protein